MKKILITLILFNSFIFSNTPKEKFNDKNADKFRMGLLLGESIAVETYLYKNRLIYGGGVGGVPKEQKPSVDSYCPHSDYTLVGPYEDSRADLYGIIGYRATPKLDILLKLGLSAQQDDYYLARSNVTYWTYNSTKTLPNDTNNLFLSLGLNYNFNNFLTYGYDLTSHKELRLFLGWKI